MIGCPGPLERACGPALVERGGAATVPTTAATNTIAATAALASGQVVLSSGFPGVQAGRERLTGLAPYPTGAWQPSSSHHNRPCMWCLSGSELSVHAKSLGSRRPLATMPQATALGTLVLLLLLPLPRSAEVTGNHSNVALDYGVFEGEEGTEQQLHYHDPCKAGRYHRCPSLRASQTEVCL